MNNKQEIDNIVIPPEKNSIAVLPFKNISHDIENEYFSDGISEEIINALAKIDGLYVTARTSSFNFKGKNEDIRLIGKQLGVSSILEGSVRKAGNRVRVTAQHINALNGYHLWSETFDSNLQDIFAVQDEISKKIVEKFKEKLNVTIKDEHLVNAPTESLEAYDLFLKGRFHLSKSSLNDIKIGINYFEAAIKKDVKFVLPYTGLCASYTFLGGSRLMEANKAFALAEEYAIKAIELNDSIAESHLSLAYINFWNKWDFKSTSDYINRAVQLSPGTAEIHGFKSSFLLASECFNEALIEAQLAIKLDPLSLRGKYRLGEIYFRSERYVEAIEQFNLILEKNPFYQQASILKAWSHLFAGESEEAIKIFNKIPITHDHSITFYGALAFTYARIGNIEKVLECLKTINSLEDRDKVYLLNYSYALVFRALGETDKMYHYLEKSLNEKIATLIFIRVDPVWKEFRNDKTFTGIVGKAFDQSKKEDFIVIKTDTREKFSVNYNNLLYIEAQENYSKVVWLDENTAKEKLLRVTLKNIESQISTPDIIRCHRSYMINLKVNYSILGNSNGYKLKSKYFTAQIPISRTLGKEIVQRLRGIN